MFALSSPLPISLRHSRFHSRPLPSCNWSTSILWALESIQILGADMKSRKMTILLTDFLKEESLHYWMLYVLIRDTEVAAITWLCVETILPLSKAGYTRTRIGIRTTGVTRHSCPSERSDSGLDMLVWTLLAHIMWVDHNGKCSQAMQNFRLNAQNNDYKLT